MACDVCFDLPGVWVETDDGPVIRPCPWCGPRDPRATGEDPYRITLEVARNIAADNPAATDDQVARLIHAQFKGMRMIVGRDNGGDGCEA